MKKFLFLFHGFDEGGVPKRVILFSKILSEKGYQVFIAGRYGRLIDSDFPIKVKFIRLSPNLKRGSILVRIYAYVKSFLILYKNIKTLKIETIINDSRYTSVMAKFIAILLKVNYVSVAHGEYSGKNLLVSWFWGKRIMCVSNGTRNNLITKYKVKPKRTLVIKNSIPPLNRLEPFEIDSFKRHNNIENTNNLCCVARFDKIKGVTTLIRAWKVLSDWGILQKEYLRLLLVGHGPLEKEIKSYIKDNNLNDYITLFKPDINVSQIIQSSIISILPSLREGIPTFVLESFSLGVPLIATNVNGTKEIVRDGYNGLLVKVNNPTDLASKIKFLIEEKEIRENLAINSLKTYQTEFAFNMYKTRIEDFFTNK